jgi:hypothetical protein
MISDFRREVAEICTLLGCYAASSGNFLPTFRDKLSVPSARVHESKRKPVAPKRSFIGKSVDGENVSLVRCQPVELLQVVERSRVW